MSEKMETPVYPDCYLHVRECRSGQTWIMPIHPNSKLDLKRLIKRWADQEFCGELHLDGELQPRLEGDYFGSIFTDGRSPESGIVWESAGFWLKGVEV